jgi:hypothetical protein
MSQYTVPEIIEIAKISQYLSQNDIDNSGLYGGGMDLRLPEKIYCVRKNIEWMQGENPSVSETRAEATITIDVIGDDGDGITVYVNDPFYGLITLGFVVQSPLTNTINLIAEQLGASIGTNPYGYEVTVLNNEITIIAREGLGALINGNSNLIVDTGSGNYITTESSSPIQTENSYNLIIE